MKMELYQIIASSTAHRKSRDELKNYFLEHPRYFKNLLTIAFSATDKNHHKACWVLELICEEKLELLSPEIDFFCNSLHLISNESALRSLTKICLFLSKSKKILLTDAQVDNIVECCFDCLITTEKAANAAYSMRSLYEFSLKNQWIKEDLKAILTRDISDKTPGYCFAVKDILKRLK